MGSSLTELNTARDRLRRRPRVVIGHPYMGRGGSESVVLWLIEALKSNFDVTVMTTGGWDLTALNSFYGTNVSKDEVTIRIAPIPRPFRRLGAAALRGSYYQRFARQISSEYDLRISACNPTDWGSPAVHFLADFSWDKQIRERFDPASPGFIYRDSLARRAYLGFARARLNPSHRDVLRDDAVIANSHWSAALIKEQFAFDCAAIIYPPVWAEFPAVPWGEKEEAFAMIGRIAPEKRIERAITILEAVRRRGHSIRLHLCGEIHDDLYGRQIKQLCRERADWIVVEGLVSGERKAQILSRCRYGIQMRAAEPFGISVAEMIKAGAIVFAPSDGGQAEIIQKSDLLFVNDDDAVAKIVAVLNDPDRRSALRAHIAVQSQLFGSQRFVRDARGFIMDRLVSNRSDYSIAASQTA